MVTYAFFTTISFHLIWQIFSAIFDVKIDNLYVEVSFTLYKEIFEEMKYYFSNVYIDRKGYIIVFLYSLLSQMEV